MELFDKKFVYFMWDDTLFGKRVFVADHISNLKEKIDNGELFIDGDDIINSI